MKYFKSLSILLIISIYLISCNNHTSENEKSTVLFTYQPDYAEFFRIEYFDDYKKISILNPWKNEELNINYYILSDKDKSIAEDKRNFVLDSPVEKTIALSSPMVGLLHLLHLDSSIIGVSDPELIYTEEIYQKFEEGHIANVGKSIAVDMETLMSLRADLVVGSGWDKMSTDFERMIQLQQTPLLMYDWQETHPLGKAEWMILLASFYNQEANAQKQFQKIEDKYMELKSSVHYDKKPSVFNGSEYQGIWYSAGGQSYMSQLYQDAGANYIMKNDSSKGSLMLDFEVIMAKAEKADIWMYTGSTDPHSLSLLKNPKYQSMDAAKKHRVYSYHKKINERGANEYWEMASYQPDIVLQDLIRIFHDSDPENLHFFDLVEY